MTVKQICNYYDFKEDNPEFFEGVNLSKLFKMGEHDILSVPPYRDQLGRRLLLYRIGIMHFSPCKSCKIYLIFCFR